jgi:hypothetical protein
MPDFKEILDNLPEKPPRSRLEPYRESILEMRRRGRPLREIARVRHWQPSPSYPTFGQP